MPSLRSQSRKLFRTVRSISEEYDVHRNTVYGYVDRGILPAVRIGQTIRILEADWQAFLLHHRVNAVEEQPARGHDEAGKIIRGSRRKQAPPAA